MKYTYNTYQFNEDYHGKSSGKGGTNFKNLYSLFKKLTKYHPMRVHLIIRKPDNKLMAFYHPYDKNGEVLQD